MHEHPGQNHDLEDDDLPVGQVLDRRHALRLFGLAGGAALVGGLALARQAGPGRQAPAAAGLPGCVVRPQSAQGPFFTDERLRRRDIRTDSASGRVAAGVPLTLTFQVSRVGLRVCEPLAGVVVDVWHCDALGMYSDVSDQSFDTRGQDFLRGYQTTNAQGRCSFQTIYPGWYRGRAVHIHYRLRTLDARGRVSGDFVSQLFFEEALSEQVHALMPYRQKGRRDTLNRTDGLYRNGGNQMLIRATGTPQKGLVATFDVGLLN